MIAHSSITGILETVPEAAGVFERYHIDYWHDGNQALSEICKGDALRLFNIVREIHVIQLQKSSQMQPARWSEMSAKDLCRYIVEHHHSYIKSALPALVVHGFQVAGRFAGQMPQLNEVKNILTKIRAEFTHHMMREEDILFPRIIQLEDIAVYGADPDLKIRMIVDPLKVILKEHSHTDNWFAEIRRLTNNFKYPSFADPLLKLFYQELGEFESDLHMHVYLENNILFPEVNRLIRKIGY